MLLGDLPLIFTVLLLWFLVSLILAPLEALGWWAGWLEGDETREPEAEPEDKPKEPANTRAYLVYLTGISGVSGEILLDEESEFLERLDAALPDVMVVKDVYPYSVRNRALTGQRVFAWFWRFALKMKLSGRPLQRFIGLLINIRNAFQVMVSADRRYGPIYNASFARLILQTLLWHGYERDSGKPIYLLGYSGGGQIAVGVVPYLKRMTGAPITVISLGGVIGGDPGVVASEYLYHIYGKRDGVQRLGLILSPSRWGVLYNSRWNQSRRQNKIDFIYVGNMRHNGKQGYLDDEHSTHDDGRSNMAFTVDGVAHLVQTGDTTALQIPQTKP